MTQTTFEQGQSQVAELVKRFSRNAATYRSPEYNETRVRIEFINPLFEALGWDVNNREGVAPQYQEVLHEFSAEVEGTRKAPDYAFRTGSQAPKFYVEAKKPGVNVKTNADAAYQLRRYAWSARLLLSLLTDFEELAVYDCRSRPSNGDKASVGRVQFYACESYPDRWRDIWDVFSRQAVREGSFDRFAPREKGKGELIDSEFLKEIQGWRELLARNMALRNAWLSPDDLNDAVQRTIDRIIFMRMAEDRGIEEYGRLLRLAAPTPSPLPSVAARFASAGEGSGIYAELIDLCRRADARYNSGLFDLSADTLTPRLSVDDKALQSIIGNLYFPSSPYEFSVLPIRILGNIYEQFLGQVIRLTAGHQAKVEEKPEVKKAGGVYYTPEYIVDYIVRRTVGQLVEGKSPKQLAGFRALDMACGSGSFLLGAYQCLLDYYLRWYSEHQPEKRTQAVYQAPSPNLPLPGVQAGQGGGWRLTIAEKKRILTTHIFGVDIDRQAVEVTKLSLLLKVLEGESDETLGQQLALFQERALPNLDNNVKCGNSLIGPDYFTGQLMPDADELRRVNPFDWETQFPDAMKAGGFDCVIGNPPYIRIQRIPHGEADYLFKSYKSPTSKTDISLVFIEKGLALVARKGLVGLICTSQWLATDYGRNLRSMLSDGRLQKIVDFGSLPVFEKAQTYPAIFILSPTPAKSLSVTRIESKAALNLAGIEEAPSFDVAFGGLSDEPWNLGSLDMIAILNREHISWEPLGNFGGAYIGVLTGMDDAFVVDADLVKQHRLEKRLLYPYAYRGAEIGRYKTVIPGSFVIYPYREGAKGSPELISERELRSSYPNIYKYLSSRKEVLRQRMDSRKLYASGDAWYRHLRAGSYNYIKPTKLLIKGVDLKATVGLLGENTTFNGANCPGIILEELGDHSPKYVMGVLNSRLVTYYLRMVCPAKLNDYRRFNANNLNAIPLRAINFSDPADVARHDRMVTLVEQMLELHKRQAAASASDRELYQRQIDATDREVDKLVYELRNVSIGLRQLVSEFTEVVPPCRPLVWAD